MENQDTTNKPKPKEIFKTDITQPDSKLHKQARGYLKTTGRLVGREITRQTGLFDIPHFDTAINPYKETLSKMTGITGNLLLSLWQAKKDEREIYIIDNLTSIANILGISTQELKLYLIYLAGYQRPISKLEIIKEAGKKDKRILSVYSDKLFYIKFKFRLKDSERESDFLDNQRIGTHYLSFIKDRDVESVEVMPSASIQEELQGRGLGNVLVDDSFVAFSLDLSDLAYKIFCLSGSNKPHFKISFDKLISGNYLNLESQVKGRFNKEGKRIRKGQGKARVLSGLKDAFKELLDSGYFTKWSYDEQADMFSWTYSNKIIKHKDFTRKEPETLKIEAPKTEGTGQTGQDKTGHQL